jgi:hypothetical protein
MRRLVRKEEDMKWEGHVVQLTQRRVYGVVECVDNGNIEELRFPRKKVRKSDRDLLAVGALFKMTVSGGKCEIKFERYPPWTEKEIKAAEAAAKRQAKFFKVE